jgi:tripartite ATP-independent transporter DctM subunit
MNPEFIITIVLMLLFMIANVPIWASIILACVPYFLITKIPIAVLASNMAGGGITSFILLAFPLFSLAGSFMNSGDISKRIFDFADTNAGWMRGGLGQVNILASLLFAGMSGSAIADISGLGRVEMKGMMEKGYDREFSTGITLASSVLGPIIPPSTPVILYSVSSGVSVLALFVGGFLPGFLIAGTLMVMVYFISLKRDYARRKFPTFKEIILSWKEAFFSLLTPVIILVGMFTGIVTPTEAAAVAVVYSAAVGLFIYKTMSFKSFIKDIRDTALFCANTYAIIAASMVLSFIFTRENIGIYLANLVVAAGLSQTLVIFLLLIIVLLLGCFIEVSAMIILIIPILLPIVQAVGYSTLAFGIIFVLTSVLGILTPPFGLGLFIGAEITGMEFWDVFKAVLPFFIPLVIAIILMVFFPQIVTVLPELLLK